MKLKTWITRISKASATPVVSNSDLIVVWDADLDKLQSKWVNDYMNKGYDIEEPVDVKLNHKTMQYEYRFIVKKHCC